MLNIFPARDLRSCDVTYRRPHGSGKLKPQLCIEKKIILMYSYVGFGFQAFNWLKLSIMAN